jgi:hypothetical protein
MTKKIFVIDTDTIAELNSELAKINQMDYSSVIVGDVVPYQKVYKYHQSEWHSAGLSTGSTQYITKYLVKVECTF